MFSKKKKKVHNNYKNKIIDLYIYKKKNESKNDEIRK